MWLSDQVVERLREVATWPEMPDQRYTVLRPLGRGGMGTVYVAHDERLGRDVALKVSNANAAGGGLDARLRREAHVLAKLDHPGIAPVHDAGLLADGRLFYVMKLVRGETLEAHAHTLDTEQQKLGLFERIAETVAFAHARGIIHRDLKPSNVMVGPFGEVLVLDWGVAKVLARSVGDADDATTAMPAVTGKSSPGATEAGVMIGTPGFMAPEQSGVILNGSEYDGAAAPLGPPADVYALGALLFWLLTDALPPAGHSRVGRVLRDRGVSRRLRAIVARSLAPRPDDRYPDAGALAADLARYRDGQAVAALPETVFDRLGRFVVTYRTVILILVAYLVMRAMVAIILRGPR